MKKQTQFAPQYNIRHPNAASELLLATEQDHKP